MFEGLLNNGLTHPQCPASHQLAIAAMLKTGGGIQITVQVDDYQGFQITFIEVVWLD